MATSKKPRKKYIRGFINPNPLAKIQPMPNRDKFVALFCSALESMSRGSEPCQEDWNQLADLVNIVRSLALHTKNIQWSEVSEYCDAAYKSLRDCELRVKQGAAFRLDGPGVMALRELIGIFDACAEALTLEEINKARNEVVRITNKIRAERASA